MGDSVAIKVINKEKVLADKSNQVREICYENG